MAKVVAPAVHPTLHTGDYDSSTGWKSRGPHRPGSAIFWSLCDVVVDGGGRAGRSAPQSRAVTHYLVYWILEPGTGLATQKDKLILHTHNSTCSRKTSMPASAQLAEDIRRRKIILMKFNF